MPAVLVHGNPETAALWRTLVSALAERGRADVVTVSPPGFGAPRPTDFGATVHEYRQWLIGELEALGGDVDLVGHDWGAGHVYGVLAERPDLIRTWAADCVGLTHPDYVWHDAAQLWQTPDVGEQVIAAMMDGDDADRVERLVGLGVPADIAAEIAPWQNAEMGQAILDLYRDAAQPAMADLGRRLAAADLPPGLVINATEDHYAGTSEMVEEMTAAVGAASVTLEGESHWWMFSGAAAAADALVAHWAGAD
ncbi:MAG: alpha/beta fold hydrolase [Actinomycetota bacterium]